MTGEPPCPLCGRPLYGWIATPTIVDRCENCGVAMRRGAAVDLGAEWEAVGDTAADGAREVAIPDRASLQASIGGQSWAALGLSPGRLLLTRRSLELLAQANGHELKRCRWHAWGRNQPWMWQTVLNGLTFHPNFAREVRAGRLRPANARSRFAFGVDLAVTVLGAPLVALVSFPLEAVAALARRGGELRALAAPRPPL